MVSGHRKASPLRDHLRLVLIFLFLEMLDVDPADFENEFKVRVQVDFSFCPFQLNLSSKYTLNQNPMKKLILFLFLFQGVFSLAQSQETDQKQLQSLIQNSFDVLFSTYDSEQIGAFYTADFLLLEHGEIWDIAKVTAYLEKAAQRTNSPVRTNRFDFFQTTVDGNRAWIGYWNYATFTSDGKVVREVKWLESATAVKTDQGWRLDMLHSTPVE